MNIIISKERLQMRRRCAPVSRLDEEAIHAILDLERDAPRLGGDDGSSGMQGLGDLDLEAFPGGELENHVGVGDDGVEELVVGLETHDAAVVDEVWVVGLELVQSIVVDYAGVWVVDGPVSAAWSMR